MRKILVGIAFFTILAIFKTARTVQAATTDLSRNFTALRINPKYNKAVFNDDFVHVRADFNDRQCQIKGNSSMAISWENDKPAFIQGIPEKSNLIAEDEQGKEYKVGEYTVTKTGVLIAFNEKVEEFKNISGKVDFDIQIKNPTKNSQNLFIQAGDLSEKLHVIGQPRPESVVLSAEVNGFYNERQDEISWEIKIDPQKEKTDTIEVSNEIPIGLLLDRNSLEVETCGKKIKLNEDNVEIAEDGMKLWFDNKDHANQPIIIRYQTKVIDNKKIEALNQVTVGYLKNGKITNESTYGGKIENGNSKCIVATLLDLESSKKSPKDKSQGNKRRETEDGKKDRYLELYHEVMDLLFKGKRNKNNVNDEQKELDKNKVLSLPDTSSPIRLKGFDNTPTPLAETRISKAKRAKDIVNVLDENSDQDDKLSKANNKGNIKHVDHVTEHSSNKLPKAGESSTVILTTIGLVILGSGVVAFKLKLKE